MKNLILLFIILLSIGCNKKKPIVKPTYELEGMYEETNSTGTWELSILTIEGDSMFRGGYRDSVLISFAKGVYVLDSINIYSILWAPGEGRLGAPCPINQQIPSVFINLRFIQNMLWNESKGEIKASTFIEADGVPNTDCNVKYKSKKWSSTFKKINQQ